MAQMICDSFRATSLRLDFVRTLYRHVPKDLFSFCFKHIKRFFGEVSALRLVFERVSFCFHNLLGLPNSSDHASAFLRNSCV